MTVNGNELVGTGFPTDEGQNLANHLLAEKDLDWENLVVDLSKSPPSLLISAFFNAFWQEVADQREDLLDQARNIRWQLVFSFQKENVAIWATDFKPCVS